MLDKEVRSKNTIKPKLECIGSDNKTDAHNASMDEFLRITTCSLIEEAWDVLQTTHEGTNAIKVRNVFIKVQS